MSRSSLDLFVPSKAPSHRQKRVAQELRFCLAEALMRGDWPVRYDEQGMLVEAPCSITITDVIVSADLKNATIWVMPLGGEHQEQTMVFLELMAGYFRKQVASHLRLRTVPVLRFSIDPSFSTGARIDALLNKNSSS